MLCQDIVSTPGAELDSDLVEHHRYDGGDVAVDVWQLLLEVGEGSLVMQGAMLSDVVVVEIAQGLV